MGYESPGGYESPEEALKRSKEEGKESGNLEIQENRQEYLAQEIIDHGGITPAFRTLGEIAKELPQGFDCNSIVKVKFLLPLTDLNGLKYEYTKLDENNIFVSVHLGNKVALEATFFKNEKLEKKSNEEFDYGKTVSEGEDMRKVLPQEGGIVMIDEINYCDAKKVVATRKVKKSDFEDGGKFNKFRFIEMVGQAGSYLFLSDVNTGEKGKMMVTYDKMNVIFFETEDNIKENDELIICVKQDELNMKAMQDATGKKTKIAYGEIRKKDGTIIFECVFHLNEPMKRKNLPRYAKQKAEEAGV